MTDRKEDPKSQDIRVIDRRMFTAEGEVRTPDAPRDEIAAAPPPPPPAASAGAPPRREPPPAPTREDQVAAAHFKNLVLNLATTAAANLGEIPSPFTRETEVDLEGARQVIDLLQALRVKTRGNLSAEENELVESLLYDLKTKFVALQKKATRTS